jgi:3-oxoacyl-[acyl-carrier protein] reductase
VNTQAPPVALVIGASGTLGGAIARELIARGYATALHYRRNEAACRALSALADAKGLRTAVYAADFADGTACAALAAAVVKDFQRLDALVWAAGIMRDAPVISLEESALRETLNVNLRAPFLLLKALSRQFIKQKSGSVVVLSSRAALAGRAGGAAYAMAHGGLLALVKSAAREWGPLGVRVNAVLPPFVPDSGLGRQASPEFAAAAQAARTLKTDVDLVGSLASFTVNVLENPALSGQVCGADSRISA